MINCVHESLFTRFAATRGASYRPGKEPGRGRRDVCAISTATIKRYLKARRERGHVLPKTIPGRPNIKGAALQAGLLEQLATNADATREQHCQMWEARTGMRVSTASISRARMALGWTRKKSP
jgi:transposase